MLGVEVDPIGAMKARSHQAARVVRAARKGSDDDPSTQACSAMFLSRVTIGNQVDIGSSHRMKKAHQAPTATKPASRTALKAMKGRTDRPVTTDSY